MPGLEHTRSQSLFGLSDVKCYFDWGSTYEKARQEVINRLGFIQLPPNMQATISPWNAIGEVFRYSVQGNGYTTRDLKTAEDWILERQFKQVKGVIDVVSFGGETKQYHVQVDPYRLRGQGIQLSQLVTGIQAANQNVGGQRLVMGEQAYTVRGIGLLRDVHDIENVVVNAQKGVPTRVRDVADVDVGYAPRLGIVGHDDNPDIVQGVVLMRYGGETQPTLEGIHKRIDYIRTNHILPPGMDIVPYYDRGNLVKLTTHTVLENLVVGMLLVVDRALSLPRPHARRHHHRAQHPAGAARRLLRDGRHRYAGEPHLARRGRLRHRRRLDRHHDGEHLPAPRAPRKGHDARPDPPGVARGRRADDVLDAHHRRRLPAALHDDGRRRRHLLADGHDVRVRDRRRDRPGAHADAGPRGQVRPGADRGEGARS